VGAVVYNTRGKPLSSEDLMKLLPDVDGYIAGLDQIDRAALQAAKQLQVVARYGVGVDAVDLDAARGLGIAVTNTPGANAGSVAELALGLMLTLARNINTAIAMTRQGNWPRLRGVSLEGKTVGILGFGAIGQQLARRLMGFGCTVLAYDPYASAEAAVQLQVELCERDEVLGRSDFVSLHLPALPETCGMVNADFIEKMKEGAYLVNTARGEIVDEAALLAGLESGKIAGAALDAFIEQPPAADHPLLRHERVIVTPHMGAHTDGATNAMGWAALHDCVAVLRGEEPRYRVV
ncbi:MAG: phosphoglycerate dehydrogenase, partial [Anaerolineaceae bacterium]|nr:phosphoglycerate dehydrogenase [Anaerolineaceae bacterium]